LIFSAAALALARRALTKQMVVEKLLAWHVFCKRCPAPTFIGAA